MPTRARALLAVALVLPLALAGCTAPAKTQPEAARAKAASPSPAACARVPGSGFPPMLGGFDPRLATAPVDSAAHATPKDLVVTVLIQGACAKVASGQTVTLNYVGLTLADGKVFDSSWTRKQVFETAICE
ncbi:hypothetical protein Dvina_31590 [Dactylosporangium vinaceum]|uniref:peptidylprolyl isomerase n=1 Tax=Dactylosporangium vinaceum TaxID=53362 RepID=A0ABV5M788_9ACTN|nr:FKBP-type peptidyl-prolyl cis-trans isomerase [Dactylosporangium vinaceum]UAB92845.1 hypothetical protein Dvina_31590 [Dactylosporangium vinaceum]